MNAVAAQNDKSTQLLTPILISIFVCAFLFCIDEGYNDFRWMKDPGNWFVYTIYVSGFTLGQLFITRLIFPKLAGTRKHVVNFLVGLPVGFLFTLGMLALLRFVLVLQM